MMANDLDRITDAARSSAGRSKLYQWMRKRHDAFADLVQENRPNWQALADAFAREGLTGPGGAPLKAESVRHCWYRARRDVAASRAVRTVKPVVAPVRLVVGDPLADLKRQMSQRSGRT